MFLLKFDRRSDKHSPRLSRYLIFSNFATVTLEVIGSCIACILIDVSHGSLMSQVIFCTCLEKKEVRDVYCSLQDLVFSRGFEITVIVSTRDTITDSKMQMLYKIPHRSITIATEMTTSVICNCVKWILYLFRQIMPIMETNDLALFFDLTIQ